MLTKVHNLDHVDDRVANLLVIQDENKAAEENKGHCAITSRL